jgi:hypothetical protein
MGNIERRLGVVNQGVGPLNNRTQYQVGVVGQWTDAIAASESHLISEIGAMEGRIERRFGALETRIMSAVSGRPGTRTTRMQPQ